MLFNNANEVINFLKDDITNWKSNKRIKSARDEQYKKLLIEKTQFFYIIKDCKDVIISSSLFKQYPFWSVSEFLTEIFAMNPPMMQKYKPDIIEWSYKLRDDKTIEYTYGRRWSEWNQILNIIDTLSKRPDSKRAVIDIFTPYDTDVNRNDVPCTLMYTFKIRDNKLNMTTFFRSHDLFSGLKYDYLLSSFMSQLICMCINAKRKELELEDLNITPGTLGFYEDSLHVYELKDSENITNLKNDIMPQQNDYMFDIMFNYNTVKDVFDDLWYIVKAERSSYHGNFQFSLEKINKIKNPAFKDMAKMYYNRNIKFRKEEINIVTNPDSLPYETKILKW